MSNVWLGTPTGASRSGNGAAAHDARRSRARRRPAGPSGRAGRSRCPRCRCCPAPRRSPARATPRPRRARRAWRGPGPGWRVGDRGGVDRLAHRPPRQEAVELEQRAEVVVERRVADRQVARPVAGEDGEPLAEQRAAVGVVGRVRHGQRLVAERGVEQLGLEEGGRRHRALGGALLARGVALPSPHRIARLTHDGRVAGVALDGRLRCVPRGRVACRRAPRPRRAPSARPGATGRSRSTAPAVPRPRPSRRRTSASTPAR